MKFLVVDDHAILRQGLSALLQQMGEDVVILTAADGAEALSQVDVHDDIDLVLLDLAMPRGGGGQVIEAIVARRIDLPVVVVSASEDPADVRRSMAQGALGYVPKSADPETLLAALKLVLAGEIYVPTILLKERNESEAPAPGVLSRLTQRQMEVLDALCEGLPNKSIAFNLQMSEKTVKAHVTAIFRVLGAANRTQAVTIARQLMEQR
ncbi:response regulator transcription factor [Terricaulis sp.]|uniref:response regulator transcription factor n=1 Tax=Terricaulis sp. TaxID=2768686 RepID=UPI00378347FA